MPARQQLDIALTEAQSINDPYLLALVTGRDAQALQREGHYDKGILRAREAIFLSQEFEALMYQWQWALARAKNSQGARQEAIELYRASIGSLESLRGQGAAPVSFENAGQLYFELADLLLQEASSVPGTKVELRLITQARDNIEKTKAAELRDYFQDDCVSELRSRSKTIDRVPAGTAAIYPIALADRLEILVSLPGRVIRRVVAVKRDVLQAEAVALRTTLVQRANRRFTRHANQMYKWLIAPVEQELAAAQIKTLVFIPEGPLRLFPAAALYDGKQFLVQRFSIASSPGLTLTEASQSDRLSGRDSANQQITLLGGVTESVQGFPALGSVNRELDAVDRLTKGKGTRLQDKAFLTGPLTRELQENAYSVVHIASHAQFDANPDKTFLLTYDGRIGLSQLSDMIGVGRFRKKSLNLLTLSACQTAAGDARSALGLAGAAVQAGARSVLASLWSIDDAASARLLSSFYTELFDNMQTKAIALQRAQLELMTDRRYRHPAFWSPFLMIGNWQ